MAKPFARAHGAHAGRPPRDLTRRLFVALDGMFRIADTSLRAARRLVMDWDEIGTRERKLAVTRLLQVLRTRAPRGELLPKLQKVAVLRRLEIADVSNPETGERKPSSLLRSLALEAATAGATGASSVAASVGAGFCRDYSRSVYPPPRSQGGKVSAVRRPDRGAAGSPKPAK